MNKNEMAAEHIEDELHNAARNIAGEVNIMLYACEQVMIDKVLEIINAEYDSVTNTMNIDKEYVSVYTVINEIRAAVEALRGEQG